MRKVRRRRDPLAVKVSEVTTKGVETMTPDSDIGGCKPNEGDGALLVVEGGAEGDSD
jgi:hypothetical protein